MTFSSETIGRLLASARNYTSTAVGFIGGVGLISAANSKGLTESLGEIFTGLSMVVHGATSAWQILVIAFPVIGAGMALLASHSAKTTSQAAAVQTAVKEAADTAAQLPLATKAAIIDAAVNIPEVKNNNQAIKVGDPVLATVVPSSKVVA